jgi:hypothetical protein
LQVLPNKSNAETFKLGPKTKATRKGIAKSRALLLSEKFILI